MGAASEVQLLQARAQFMRDSLGKSQSMTESMISILGSFDHRLSSLETAMRPTQVRLVTFHKFFLPRFSQTLHVLCDFYFLHTLCGPCLKPYFYY